MPDCSKLKLMLLVWNRTLWLAYIVLAFYSFPDSQKLLDDGYSRDGDKLYIPLVLCQPNSIDVEGDTVTIDASEGTNCHNLDYLVNSAGTSLIFSGVAFLLFLLVDSLSRCKKGPLNRSTAAGMGLFLIFILIQTAVSAWALAAECKFWTDYFEKLYEAAGYGETYGISEVSTYGNQTLLFTTGIIGIVSAFFLLLDACISIRTTRAEEKEMPVTAANFTPASEKTSIDASGASVASGAADEASWNTPKW